MKKTITLFLLLICIKFGIQAQCTGNVYIPDINFKTALLEKHNIDTDADNEISCIEAEAFNGSIEVGGLGITDLTGIETFINITELYCDNNQLTSLDIANNLALTRLYCYSNNLTSLNVFNNTKLKQLFCSSNSQIESLNVSNNTSLTYLACDSNGLSELDLSNNTWLDHLSCRFNSLTSLDLSYNQRLGSLYCSNNDLNNLDLSNNVSLSWLVCESLNLENLDVSNNPKLRNIDCEDNNLIHIDVSNNLKLESLNFSDNHLNYIDVSNNLELLHLIFNNNLLSRIDLSNNTNLYSLGCANNEFTTIDISNNTRLSTFGCASNKLTELDLSNHSNLSFFACNSNNLESLNMASGLNGNVLLFYATDNPNLSCIQVDNAIYSTNAWPSIDATTSFSEDCEAFCPSYVTIPDVNFKNILLSDTSINTDGDDEICVKEAANFTGTIYAWASSISDLTGIEAFTNLSGLYCDYNNLTTLDVSKNTALVNLSCGSNSLTSLNIANGNNSNIGNFNFVALNNPDLECIQVDDVSYSTTNWQRVDSTANFSEDCSIYCNSYVNIPDANFKNILISDATINTDGDSEICYDEAAAYTGAIYVWASSISDLTGIEAFVNLTELYCDLNTITTLDVSNNTALTILSCSSNSLTSLNVANGNNLNMEVFDFIAYNNPNLSCIEVDNVVYSTTTWTLKDDTATFSTNCNIGTCIVNIPDTNFKTALIEDTSVNSNGDTEISCEEAENFTGILNVSNKSIFDLTGIEAFTNLSGLYCDYNSLTSLDVSNNLLLTNLSCSGNDLTDLNVANGNNANMMNFNFIAFNNPNLTCIEVDDVAYSITNWFLKDITANYSTSCSTSSKQVKDFNNKETSISINKNFNIAVNVYPNPVKHTLHIRLQAGDALEQVEVYNLSGKKIMTSKESITEVDSLASGVYLLKVITKAGNVTLKKIIKK